MYEINLGLSNGEIYISPNVVEFMSFGEVEHNFTLLFLFQLQFQ
jgi:hypothetical protein